MLIFIDLDGVVVNFADAAIRACGHEPAEVWAGLDPGPKAWNFFEAWLGTAADFYAAVHALGEPFWENLDAYPGGLQFYHDCLAVAPVCFLTAPTASPVSAAGKIRWFQRHFGVGFHDFLIGGQKHFAAGPGKLLVDDNEDNVAKFREAGGSAVLVPRRWNGRHAEENGGFDHVMREVRQWALNAP